MLFRDEATNLTVDTVGPVVEQGTGTPPNPQMLNVGALSGVTTNDGNIIIGTTTTGNLVLNQPVSAGAGSIALGSAGTMTQAAAGVITTTATGVNNGLEIVAAQRVSLGAFVGPAEQGTPNVVAQLAGAVAGNGENFVLRSVAPNLTVTTVQVLDTFNNTFLTPTTVAGVTTNNGNIGLRATAGSLTLAANVAAGGAAIGLEAAGQMTQTSGTLNGGALAITAGGPVSLPDANTVPLLAGRVTGVGNSFLFRDDATPLTVTTIPAVTEQGTGTPPNNQMLSAAALSGVTANNGNIILETTTVGDLALIQPVNAGTGAVGLGSAGTITQSGAGLVTAAQLETVSVNATSLELANSLGGGGTPGLAAGRVLTAGQSFGFRDEGNSVTVDTVDVQDLGGARLLNPMTSTTAAPVMLTAALSGVATQAAAGGNILIEATTSGNLLLNQRVDAAANFDPTTTALALTGPVLGPTPGQIGLSSAGTLTQNGVGLIVGSQLETVSVNATSLELPNLVGNATGAGTPGLLAGRVLTAGQSFGFRDDGEQPERRHGRCAEGGRGAADLALGGSVDGGALRGGDAGRCRRKHPDRDDDERQPVC